MTKVKEKVEALKQDILGQEYFLPTRKGDIKVRCRIMDCKYYFNRLILTVTPFDGTGTAEVNAPAVLQDKI